MSDTQPPPTPAPGTQADTWANRFTLVIGALGYLVVLGAVVLYLFQTQDVQIGLLIVGALIGSMSQGASFYTRGRVENPTQTRTGTGDGGAPGSPVTVTSGGPTTIETDSAPPPPAVRVPPANTTGGGVTLRPTTHIPSSTGTQPPEPKP